MEIYQQLPNDIINIILSYDGKIKYRKGKYVNQIEKNRYTIFTKIRKPEITFQKYENYTNEIYIRINFTHSKMQLQLSKTLILLPESNEIIYYLFIHRGLSYITRTLTLK